MGRPSRDRGVLLGSGEAGWEVLLLRISSAVRPARETAAAGAGSGVGAAEAGESSEWISDWFRALLPPCCGETGPSGTIH